MRTLLRRTILPAARLLGVLLLATACSVGPGATPQAAFAPSGGERGAAAETQMRRQLFIAANVARRVAGRAPLQPDAALDLAAQRHAEAMLRRRFFAHRDWRGRGPAQRAEQAGFTGGGLGENLARGSESAERVVELWSRRRGHRRNLLDPTFTRTGIGYATDGDPLRPRTYWVQLYGR